MRFELPAEKLLVHEMVIPVRWGDMDAMGHVNNTLYFRYMEIVRMDWIFSRRANVQQMDEGPVIINAFCNFLQQLSYPADVRVTMFVANPGRTSFETYHQIERCDEPGVVVAEGGAKTVWTDFEHKAALPLPDWFRTHLQ